MGPTLRVLHLVGAKMDAGGILSIVRNVAGATSKFGVEHKVWVNENYQEKRSPSLDYVRSRFSIGEAGKPYRLLALAPFACWQLRQVLQNEEIDLLHAHARGTILPGIMCARLCSKPIIFTNHAFATHRWFYRWVARQRDVACTVLTPNMARHYGLDQNQIRIISECCADSFFQVPLTDNRGTHPVIRLAGLGTIVRWKRWDLLLKALAKLPPAQLARFKFDHWGLTEQDPDSKHFEGELRELQVKLPPGTATFHGATTQVETTLRDADWFVLPSVNEPCSVALIEALAMGVPALASKSGGNVDIIQDGVTGLLFRTDDVDDLAAKLSLILESSSTLSGPHKIRESVKARAAQVVGEQYYRLYLEACPKSKN